MPKTLFLLSLSALLALLAGCETPPRHNDAPPQRYREAPARQDYADVRVAFSQRDIASIRDYYRPSHPHGYPPGLAKKGKVPPGQAMRLQRGAQMPREFRWSPLPRDLEGQLTSLPDGYVRIIVGADIGIMNLRTRVVVDMLEGVTD